MSESHFTWGWEATYGNAVLTLDDLRSLETMLSRHGKVAWRLEGKSGTGSGTVRTESLTALQTDRHTMDETGDLSVTVGHGYPPQPLRFEARTGRVGFLGSRLGWRVKIEATGREQQAIFEQVRRETEELFQRATVTTWPQQHPRMRLIIALGGLLSFLSPAIYVWLLKESFPLSSAVSTSALFVLVTLWYAERRISRLTDWQPPRYELAGGARPVPPVILPRDIALVAVGIVVPLLVPVILQYMTRS